MPLRGRFDPLRQVGMEEFQPEPFVNPERLARLRAGRNRQRFTSHREPRPPVDLGQALARVGSPDAASFLGQSFGERAEPMGPFGRTLPREPTSSVAGEKLIQAKRAAELNALQPGDARRSEVLGNAIRAQGGGFDRLFGALQLADGGQGIGVGPDDRFRTRIGAARRAMEDRRFFGDSLFPQPGIFGR